MFGLNQSLGGISKLSPYSSRLLHPDAVLAIRIWRAYLTLSELHARHGDHTGRPIPHLLPRDPAVLIEFDGSLFGVGFRIFPIGVDTPTLELGHRVPYDLNGDSSYQNAMELSALTMGVFFAILQGYRGCSIRIRGDSNSVLYWSQKQTFNSSRCAGTLLVLVCLLEYSNCSFHSQTEFISSEDNYICDGLSRKGSAAPPRYAVHLTRLTELCDPRWSPPCVKNFITRLKAIRAWLKESLNLATSSNDI